jgi:hypothetical protein
MIDGAVINRHVHCCRTGEADLTDAAQVAYTNVRKSGSDTGTQSDSSTAYTAATSSFGIDASDTDALESQDESELAYDNAVNSGSEDQMCAALTVFTAHASRCGVIWCSCAA